MLIPKKNNKSRIRKALKCSQSDYLFHRIIILYRMTPISILLAFRVAKKKERKKNGIVIQMLMSSERVSQIRPRGDPLQNPFAEQQGT